MPNPYILLGAVGIWLASILGGYFYGTHHAGLEYKAAIAKQDATASQLLADLTATAAKKDAAASEFARNLDGVNTDAKSKIADAAASAERDYSVRLRRLAASRTSCGSAGTAEAAPASGASDSAAGGADRLSGEIGRDLSELGKAANTLAALVRDVCIPFAAQVGR